MSYNQINHDPKYVEYQQLYEKKLNQLLDFNGPYKNESLGKFMVHETFRAVKSDDQWIINGSYYQVDYNKENPVDPANRPEWKTVIKKANEGKLWKNIYENQPFGPSWTTTWFKVQLKIPKKLLQKYNEKRWVFQFDCQNEGLVIVEKKSKEQSVYMPVTAFSGNKERTDYILNIENFDSDFNHLFYIECGNNGMFGNGIGQIDPPVDNKWFHLQKFDLIVPDWDARNLYYEFKQCKDLCIKLPQESFFKHYIRKTCLEIIDIFNSDDRSSVLKCRKYFEEKLLPKLEDYNEEPEFPAMYAFGNCHIDLSWLWPFAETKRKVVRSWASQIKFIEEYPEFQFVISQAQSVKWLKDAHPDFFNILLQHPKQFLIAGGSWVENDTNLPSGEGLSRQLFYGQRWFYKNFNKKICQTMWLPDSFGYSAALPQIGKLSQCNYFVTQKLSWNNINKFPHSTFFWQGIDGSEVLTHCPPADTYTSDCSVDDILKVVRNGKSKDIEGGSLYLFGKGDGGGGPTEEEIKKLKIMREVNKKIGSEVPSISMSNNNSPEKFFENILKLNKGKHNIPSYIGELYLEFHRGTYTTQALLKKLMRKSETLLVELEKLATYVSLNEEDYDYPYNTINSMWEDVLLCQFHDVLPGSAIEMNYKYESQKILKDCLTNAWNLYSVLSKKIGIQSTIYKQLDDSIDNGTCVVEDNNTYTFWSDVLTVKVDKKTGNITSIKNSTNNKEYIDIKTGKNKVGANQFVIFEDKPDNWQAWDTEIFNIEDYKYVKKLLSITLDEKKSTITSVFDLEDDCFLTCQLSLDNDIIKFNTKVKNWNKENKFLKVEFPVNIHNPVCTYDIQFGNKKIDTVFYKFEVCHHKYADLSEANNGVSIINDCKYGFATLGNLMKLSLLRSPKRPDGHADMGDHEFNYAIYPHAGSLSMNTIDKSIEFNRYASNAFDVESKLLQIKPVFKSQKENFNIKISSIKRAEDDTFKNSNYSIISKGKDTKSIVVKVYDPLGGEITGLARIGKNLTIHKVVALDNLEMPIEEVEDVEIIDNKEFLITLRAFEIKLFRIYLD